MTPKEAAIWQKLTQAKAYLDAANDTLKYLSFEKLTAPGVARCTTIETNIGFVTGLIELLAADLNTDRFPFRAYQVGSPERQGSRT